MTGCAVSKTASSASVESRVAEERITEARDSVVVECRDTLKEVTTVTVILREPQDRQSPPDTVKVSTVTDRTRASVRDRVRDAEVKIVERIDTVYVAVRDSTSVKESLRQAQGELGKASPFVSALKWVFWIIVSITVLLIEIKMFNLFKV